jgi:hypothetical protein
MRGSFMKNKDAGLAPRNPRPSLTGRRICLTRRNTMDTPTPKTDPWPLVLTYEQAIAVRKAISFYLDSKKWEWPEVQDLMAVLAGIEQHLLGGGGPGPKVTFDMVRTVDLDIFRRMSEASAKRWEEWSEGQMDFQDYLAELLRYQREEVRESILRQLMEL